MKIIDVSHHQGKIDWNKVRQTDVEGVIIRAGYGNGNVDNEFKRNIREVFDYGFTHVGIYWFSYAYSTNMAINEALECIKLIEPYKNRLDLGVYFDWEYDSMNYAKKNGVKPDKNLITCMNISFCNVLENNGYIAGYYLNEDYAKNYIMVEMLNKYRKWYARYSSKARPTNAYLHQYSSKGKVDGIKGNVDMNKLLAPLTVKQIALEVIDGKWGNGVTRKNRLESAGYDYREVQNMVNFLLK